jgi:hypothetical protein
VPVLPDAEPPVPGLPALPTDVVPAVPGLPALPDGPLPPLPLPPTVPVQAARPAIIIPNPKRLLRVLLVIGICPSAGGLAVSKVSLAPLPGSGGPLV